MIRRLKQEVDFFRKQAEYTYKAQMPESEKFRVLTDKLDEANEHLGD